MIEGGALRVISLFGIPVKIHWTFGLLFLYVGYIGVRHGMPWQSTLLYGLFVICLFICVVLHELGHALMARRFNVKTVDIILSPIGGVARLTHLPSNPKQEFLIAIAGPLVNVAIAILVGIIIFGFGIDYSQFLVEREEVTILPGDFLPLLLVMNIVLFFFNLIPAFPMDGGRVLRALLSMRWSRVSSTLIAVRIGQILAVLFVLGGLWMEQFVLPFIGVFIYLSAANELKHVRMDDYLSFKTVEEIYRDQFTVLYEFDPISYAWDRSKRTLEQYFLVSDVSGHISGYLSVQSIQKALQAQDMDNFIQAYKSTHIESIDAEMPLKHLYQLFYSQGFRILPVYKDGTLVGVVDQRSFMG
ncbi:MAG: site-2 protease family protein [Saprospiraceae bacterium]|nr:site-2 protease family protein [Saprospiraceae bacterium]